MKWKNTFILTVVAIGLGAYIYFIEIKKAEKDEKAKESAEKILDFSKEQVVKIYIKNSHGEIKLEKVAQTGWQMTLPVTDQSNESDVNSFLGAIETQKYDEIVSEGKGVDLKPYGLDNPRMILELGLNTGATKKLLIGNDGAIAGKLYLMQEGTGKVLFATSAVKYQVDKAPKDLREKKIVRVPKDEIKGFIIKNSRADNNTVVEAEEKDSIWRITKPVGELADGDTVASVLASIDNLRAGEFVSDAASTPVEKKKFKLDHPVAEVSLFGKDHKPLGTLLMAEKSKSSTDVMWVEGKTVFETMSEAAGQFNKKPEDFRDKKSVLKFAKTDVTEIAVKTGLAQVHLQKGGGKWVMEPFDDKKEVNTSQVDNLLERLSELKISEFLEKAPRAFTAPKGEIVLKDSKGDSLLKLQWDGKTPSGKSIMAKTDKAEHAFGLDPKVVDSLPAQTLVQEKAK